MEKFICIHGHFYQPPRENPWLEAIELQESASPYHDWNERIAAECYAPNATARILDGENRIVDIINNYSKISFNFGPTLLSWMQAQVPEIYQAILDADRESAKNYSGHGSALAQVYNHIILPLANARDKRTQVMWGIRDFESRFGRKPEGMWLAETAADLETLDVLAEHGILFTILSPYQASRVRKISGRSWRDVNGGQIDPTRAYEVRLPSKRKIAVFFYDGPVSRGVAFEGLLLRGENLANRLMTAFNDRRDWDQLVHIATDGESYGHHHRHGEMALAFALKHIRDHQLARLTNYGEFLEKHPPTHQAEIHDKSAWSCPHGVDRWRRHCGCNSGRPGWNQEWRAPLREALDWMRDQLAPEFEAASAGLLRDPWKARDAYIEVLLDRSHENTLRFLGEQAARELSEGEQVKALKLLELQRHALLMYTSCGWFFDEISGIETVQVIQYAARAIQLAGSLFGRDLEPGFLEILGRGRSNIPAHQNGRVVYEKFVKPAMVDWGRVGAHYAVSSLFEAYPENTRIYSYRFEQEDRRFFEAGKAKLAIGKTRVASEISFESASMTYGVLYLGEHNLNGGVREFQGDEAYQSLISEMQAAFDRADFPEIIRLMDRHFGESNYSLRSLFRDERHKILSLIMASTLADVEERYRSIVNQYMPLMRFLNTIRVPLPQALRTAAEFVLNADLCDQFRSEEMDARKVQALLQDSAGTKGALDIERLGFIIKGTVESLMQRLAADPQDLDILRKLESAAGILRSLPFDVNLWKVQNGYYRMLQSVQPAVQERAGQGDEEAGNWIQQFRSLGEQLGFILPQLQT